jgi:CPA2 family monovalent cation:H+ antiporter-2
MGIVTGLLIITVAAVLGGFLAKILKLPVLVGYIISGIVFGAILPQSLKSISELAQIGTILLLFSVGVELSFSRLSKYLKISTLGSLSQMIITTLLLFLVFGLLGVPVLVSWVLAIGFSLSSTAVVVKILSDKGETETIHGQVMLGWLLVQDLAVIPIMVILPLFGSVGGGWVGALFASLVKVILLIIIVVILGRKLTPILMHKIAETNSRELLLLTSVALAFGTAAVASLLGVSPALGAFLAGVAISESQQHHAVFAETRPLRDLFMALFFVTLGLLVNLGVVISHLPLILGIAVIVLTLKILVVFALSVTFGYRGKTGVNIGFGLSQVGEFAFVIFSAATIMGLLTSDFASISISVALLTLILAPILIRSAIPFWRKMRSLTAKTPSLYKLFSSGEKSDLDTTSLKDHIIICGYGRVGSWIGKALQEYKIPFVVVDYSQKVVQELKEAGTSVVYGDPTEPEVLEAVAIRGAKAIILAIPDRVAQETLIAYVQTVAPAVKIISRAHEDSDWEKLKTLRVDKVVQPEFEAAVAIVRSVLVGRGKSREEISEMIKRLRLSHAN